MKVPTALVTPLLAFALAGCGKPVPADKAAYVGEWRERSMYLAINQDGTVNYKRSKGGSSVAVNGPIKSFKGSDFEVGIGPMSTTFVVTREPYQVAGQWKMVVDGVELTRAAR